MKQSFIPRHTPKASPSGSPKHPTAGTKHPTQTSSTTPQRAPQAIHHPQRERERDLHNRRLRGASPKPSAPVTASQAVDLAWQAVRNARRDNDPRGPPPTSGEVAYPARRGVTVDLSGRGIASITSEVVEIIKNNLERLALSHNLLTTLPPQFSQCTGLRYLNVRSNAIEDFPLALCELKSLEILDLGRNKLRALPEEIVKLSSLKVLAVQRNKIEELPLCLAGMASLLILKLDGNPIRFPPRDVLEQEVRDESNNEGLDSEYVGVVVTSRIKRFLKHTARVRREQAGSESGGDGISDGTETPRVATRRFGIGRFPSKMAADSPRLGFPVPQPPNPAVSHFHDMSPHSSASQAYTASPLQLQFPQPRFPRRFDSIGAIGGGQPGGRVEGAPEPMRGRPADEGNLPQSHSTNRYSFHNRGHSYSPATMNPYESSPTTPGTSTPDEYLPPWRSNTAPVVRSESQPADPVLDVARGILAAVLWIHPIVQSLASLARSAASKRSSLEMIVYNSDIYLEELERAIYNRERGPEDAHGWNSENLQRACTALVKVYVQICSNLMSNAHLLVENGEASHIRAFLLLVYGTCMELRIVARGHKSQPEERIISPTIRPSQAAKPLPKRALSPLRQELRPQRPTDTRRHMLQVSTDIPPSSVFQRDTTPTAPQSLSESISSATTASSATSSPSIGAKDGSSLLRSLFISVQKASQLVMQTLPALTTQFAQDLKTTNANATAVRTELSASPEMTMMLQSRRKQMIDKCSAVINQTKALESGFSSSSSLFRSGHNDDNNNDDASVFDEDQSSRFLDLCDSLIIAWAAFGYEIKECGDWMRLRANTKIKLRDIQKAMKETTELLFSISSASNKQ